MWVDFVTGSCFAVMGVFFREGLSSGRREKDIEMNMEELCVSKMLWFYLFRRGAGSEKNSVTYKHTARLGNKQDRKQTESYSH